MLVQKRGKNFPHCSCEVISHVNFPSRGYHTPSTLIMMPLCSEYEILAHPSKNNSDKVQPSCRGGVENASKYRVFVICILFQRWHGYWPVWCVTHPIFVYSELSYPCGNCVLAIIHYKILNIIFSWICTIIREVNIQLKLRNY